MTPYHLIVLLAAVLYIIALVVYTPMKWWKSWTGRVLWGTLFTKTIAVVIIVLSFYFGDYDGREVVRYIAYSLILANAMLVLFGILSAQHIGRKAKQNVRTELEALARTHDSN